MATLPVSDGRVENPLQEVQLLQKDLKAFSRAVNKPLRDNITYPTFSLDAPQSSRIRGLPASQNPGDVAILDRLKFIRALPGKAQTAALVRQALTLQDGNARAPSTSSTPPSAQRHRKGSAQPTPRQDQADTRADSSAPVTAADFQDQLYDTSGAIDLTRVRLKINQHQQELIAAGLQAPADPEPPLAEITTQDAPQSKLRWQLAAGRRSAVADADYTLSQHDKQSVSTKGWVHLRKLWEEQETVPTHQEGLKQQQCLELLSHEDSRQVLQQLPGQIPHQLSGHFAEQSLASGPTWTQSLGFQALPQETWQDNSTAAYQALLSEEAQRMLRHASPDGTHFQANSLLRIPQHLVPLLEACKTLQGLQSLDLSFNSLLDPALVQLQDLAGAGVQLTSLDLSHNQFSSQAAPPLCNVITHSSHPALSHGISQRSSGIPLLQQTYGSGLAAQDSAADPASIDQDSGRSDSPASAASGEADVAASSSAANQQMAEGAFGGSQSRLAGAVSTSGSGLIATTGASLRRLVLSHNPLGDRGLAGLSRGCPKGHGVALIELALEDCRLGCLCAKPLAAIMQDWTSLRQLSLSWNDLGLRGAQAVAEAVRVNSTLVSLDLSHCGLTDMAGAQIALSLAANRVLQHLDLSSNQLQAASCAALGHVIAAGCQLQHLRLDANPLGKQGAVCLIQATSSGECKLRQLQMHGCGIADMAFVHDAIQRRAAEALANAKQPKKKKAKKKKKGAQEEPPDSKKTKKAPPPAAPAAKPGLEHHTLDLEKPSDWAALVGLVQIARAGTVTWKNLVLAGKKRPGPLPPDTWPAEMPMSGKVEFDVKSAVTKPDEAAAAAAMEAASTPEDSFCQLIGANLSRDSPCLDDWRLQLLELLPAAHIQLTEAQALKMARSFPGLLDGLLRSEDQHRALTALGHCCKQLPMQLQPGSSSSAQQAKLNLNQLSLT